MNFEDYNSLVSKFNGILKNPPLDAQAFKTHFYLIAEKIIDAEVFKLCFKKHIQTSDFFPSHIDIWKQIPEAESELLNKRLSSDPKIIEIKRLKKLVIDKNDEFIANKDPNKVDILRKELFDLQDQLKKTE